MSKLHRDNAGYIGCSHEETQDPYYSYNKLALPLTGSDDSIQRPAEVTHTVTVAGGKFVIGGVSQASVSLIEGGVYKFDQSDSSNSTHPFKFSQTSNGTWNRGTEYTKGVSYVGTPGSSGAYTQLVVPFGGLDLFYYCGNHTNMGGSAATPANAGMATIGLPILHTTDQVGKTLGSGVNPDPFAANLVLAVPMNGSNNGTTFTDQSAAIKGSGSAKAITLYSGSSTGGGVTSTDQSNYYGSSFYVVRGGVNANASDYITRTGDTDLSFGTDDFTVEFWFYPTSLVNNYVIFDNRHPTTGWPSSSNGFSVYGNSSGTIHLYSGGSNVISADYAIQGQANKWHHFAITRNNGRTSLFINAERKGSAFDGRDYNQSRFTLGSSSPNGEGTSGYFNDLRIYKGVAKYRPEGSGSLGMDAITYVGTGATNTISSLAFKPDLVWIKGMATGSNTIQHVLQDTVRGTSAILSSQQGNKEADFGTHWGYISSFNDDGFTLTAGAGGPDHNNHAGTPYAAWCWKAGGPATSVTASSLNSSVYDQSQNWTNLITFNAGAWNGNGTNPFDADATNNDNGNTTRANGGYATLNISSLTGSRVISVTSQQTEVTITHDGGTSTFTPPHTSQITHTFDAVTNPTSIKFDGLNSNSVFVLVGVTVDGKRLINSGISLPNVPSLDCSVSANNTHGFAITTWSGDGNNNKSVSHGLSTAPSWVVIKNRDATTSWHTFVRALDPNGRYQLYLDGTQGSTDFGTNFFNADSNVINLIGGSSAGINGNGADYVAYSWSEVANFSKFGSYSGAANLKITTGFKPRLVFIKCSSEGGFNWVIVDGARGNQSNGVSNKLYPNSGTDENNDSRGGETKINFLDDGFQFADQGAETNSGGRTYIYAAFAESAPGDPGQDAFRELVTLDTKDLSSSAHIVTNNGASFQTGVKKFYDGAAEFDGSSSFVRPADSDDFKFGTGDFTVECWVYTKAHKNYIAYLDTRESNLNSNANWSLAGNAAGDIYVYSNAILCSGALSLNQWHHAAYVREGGVHTLYLDGSPVQSSTTARDYTDNKLTIGATSNGDHDNHDGYIQDVRVYKGIAKYTSSFSPPERSIQGTARRYPSGVYVVS